ncbi:MAG: ABC transporter ATP-binding protein [Candidatus Omnitrophica bacterium]|nr:ABC transporter ATP-binding protein [Candidatus Omnitrophota bacterium]
MSNIIELEQIVKLYQRGNEKVHAIDGINLSIAKGEFVAIVGPSGSGKSTLMHLIGCVDKPSSGVLKIDGVRTDTLQEKELAKIRNTRIGFVFQQFFLLPTLTALENIMLPTVFSRNEKPINKKKQAVELLSLVGLADRGDHLPSQLSGGEMQRVAIARALINEPKTLLADEPTGNLDSRNSEKLVGLLKELNKSGQTIIMITHNNDLATVAQRIIYLKDGRIFR